MKKTSLSITNFLIVVVILLLICLGFWRCSQKAHDKDQETLMLSISESYLSSAEEYLSITEGLTEEEIQQSSEATMQAIMLSEAVETAQDTIYSHSELTELMEECYEYAMNNDREKVIEVMNDIKEYRSEYK